MRRLLSVLLIGLLPAPAFAVDARGAPEITTGSRVRLSTKAAPKERVKGTVGAMDETSLTIVDDDHQTLKLPREGISSLEVGFGKRTRARRGALIAGVIMAADVVLLCALDGSTYRDGRYVDTHGSCGSEDVGPILAAVGFGTALGAGIGALIKTDRWIPVSTDRVAVGIVPNRRGAGVALSLRF
jgi:hypothetical protein